MRWLLLTLRRWRLERTSTASLAVFVVVSAAIVGIVPGLHDGWAATSLRSAVASAPAASRNLQLTQIGRIEPDPERGFASVEAAGTALEARLPEPVRALIASRSATVESPRWVFVDPGPLPRAARFHFQPGVEPHLRLVAGRWPTDHFETVSGWRPKTFPIEIEGPLPPVGLFEAALGRSAAETIGVRVGDVLRLELDRSDPLNGTGFAGRFGQLAVRVVGLFEVVDPADPYWFGDPPLDRSVRRFISMNEESEDVRLVFAPSAYDRYMAETARQEVVTSLTWRYVVDPARLSPRTVDALLVGLRQLGTVFRDPTGTPTNLRTNLLAIVEAEQAGFRSADVAATAAATGPLLLALACLFVVAGLVVRRRRGTLALWRGRGASSVHVAASLVGEGLLVFLPLGLLAGVVAGAVAPVDDPWLPAALGLGVALVVIGSTTAAALAGFGSLRPGAGRPAVDEPANRQPSARRRVLELAVAGFALVAAYLLRERGPATAAGSAVAGSAAGGAAAGGSVDPLLAAVPALLGLSLGLLGRRTLPLVLRPVARAAARSRGFVAVHAARRLAAAAGHGPIVLALVTATTVGGYSASALARLGAATDAVAWQAVGADFRMTRPGGVLPEGTDPAGVAGVVAAASAHRAESVVGTVAEPVEVLAVDVAAYRRILATAPFPVDLPAELEARGPDGTIPTLVGERLGVAPDELAPGATFGLLLGGRPLMLRVLGLVPSVPTAAADGRFVVVDRGLLAAAGLELPTTDLFVAAEPAARDSLKRFAAERPGLLLADREAETRRLQEEPIVAGLTAALLGASLLAAVYAVVLVLASMLVVGAGRSLEGGLLEVLGLPSSARRRLLLLEYGPLLVVAALIGVAAGVALEAFLADGLRLEVSIGRPLPPGLSAQLHGAVVVDASWLLVLLVAAAAIAGLGAWWAARAERPIRPAAILRGEVE
ncbi:MAG TPA: FtsX-like permease family protein [Candidatus Binatia bacterium]|nr:FtsX-like permease family protein [Candidatus Binatia bacterium]